MTVRGRKTLHPEKKQGSSPVLVEEWLSVLAVAVIDEAAVHQHGEHVYKESMAPYFTHCRGSELTALALPHVEHRIPHLCKLNDGTSDGVTSHRVCTEGHPRRVDEVSRWEHAESSCLRNGMQFEEA